MKKAIIENPAPLRLARKNESPAPMQGDARSRTHAEGYFAGSSMRQRGEQLSGYVLVGIDEYCLGVRAGYFARKQRAGPGVAPADTPAGIPAMISIAGNRD